MKTNFVPNPIDERLRLEPAATTKTATFNGTTFDFGAGFAPGGHGQAFSAVLDVSALDLTSANETYTATVQESDNGSDWTAISPALSITAVGVASIPVFVSSRRARVLLTLGGTTPSITYEAWLVPH